MPNLSPKKYHIAYLLIIYLCVEHNVALNMFFYPHNRDILCLQNSFNVLIHNPYSINIFMLVYMLTQLKAKIVIN